MLNVLITRNTQDNVVRVTTITLPGEPNSHGPIPSRTQNIFLLQSIQALCSVETWEYCPGLKPSVAGG
jgi:hypothetical protein